MKVKEIDRTANIAWSPSSQVPIYLAAGTAAQQLDASFSTTSNLEIYSLNLSETGHDMPCVASLGVDQRFHSVVWGGAGMADQTHPSGLIVGGADRGVISLYDAAKLITGENALVFSQDKHTGPVTALDFNPFQANLLASGGSESELYIWDVNKLSAPMTPGAKSQPLDDIRCVAWNRQVQHILASTFATRCVVWDLRKNDPIIKVSDSTSRMRCKVVAWHPEVATQLCLASEDDHTPVIQIWDLRLASSPLKTLEGHQKGVLSVAWCKEDSDLLLSCGKDNRILVWNPNSPQGDIVAELPTSNQWSFDVKWCPRNPAIIASASFDGHVSLYSLMGGQQQAQPTNRITDSFGPGMDNLQPAPSTQVTMQLKSPPKWLRRPCGATFGFGGKLVTFENVTTTTTNTQGAAVTQYKPQVYFSRVVTETELVERSVKLETSLESGNLGEFCSAKLSTLPPNSEEAKLWSFIGASLSPDSSTAFLKLLGLDLEEVKEKLERTLKPANASKVNGMAGAMGELGLEEKSFDEFELIGQTAEESKTTPTPLDKSFSLERREGSPETDTCLALLIGSLDQGVQLCVEQGKWADALILAAQGGGDLLRRTQALYFQRESAEGGTAALIEAVVMDSWERMVTNCDLSSWQEVLAALVVYCEQTRRLQLAGQLATRLAGAGSQYRTASILASIVAADLEHVVETWVQDTTDPRHLQDLVEVAVMLRAAVQAQGLAAVSAGGSKLSANLSRYATLLASQGCLSSALLYLGDTSNSSTLQELKERLEKAIAGPVSRAGSYQQQQVSSGGYRQQQQQQQQQPYSRGSSGQPGSRRQSVLERKVSDPYSSGQGHSSPPHFNTGLPSQYPATGGLPAAPHYNPPMQQPAAAYTGFTPAPLGGVPTYGLDNRAPTPSYGGGNMEPAPQLPPPAANIPPPLGGGAAPTTAGGGGGGQNPLLRRGRAVDPSIAPPGGSAYGGGGGYGSNSFMPPGPLGGDGGGYVGGMDAYGGMQQQQMYGGGGGGGGVPAPAIFTPEVPTLNPIGAVSSAPGAPVPPGVGFQHVPDHGGPGHTPLTSSGPGWNDPPPFMSRPPTQPTTVTDSLQSQAPITTPLVGGGGAPEPQQHAPPSSWGGFTPAAVPAYQQAAPAAPEAAPAAAPQPPRELPPIPAEHKCIQEVLETLKSRCVQAANHPQTRRKLDDVSVKLEILYNKLRESVLSPATLQGLHSIIQHIWQYDYQSCLQVISGLIAGGSFAELADFMPGVKILLQVAQQAGVYVEYQQ